MIKFIYNAQYCRLDGDYSLEVVRKATSYAVKHAYFVKAYKERKWDGRVHLTQNRIGPDGIRGPCFPTGLIHFVHYYLKAAGNKEFEFLPMQQAPEPAYNPIHLEGAELRDYQLEAIKCMLKAKRGILDMATASGKTEAAIGFTQTTGLSTLFVVYGTSLVQQTYDRYKERLKPWLDQTGFKVGMITGTHFDPQYITIASSSKLSTMLKRTPVEFAEFVKPYQVLILDECHMDGADTFFKTCMNIPAPYRFGLSGTPTLRTDGANKRVFGVTGPIIYRVTNKEMISRGVSAKTTIEFVPVNTTSASPYKLKLTPSNIPFDDGTLALNDYNIQYKTCIIHNQHRNKLIYEHTDKWLKQNKQIIILIKEIEHGNILHQLLLDNNIANEFLHGEHTNNQREHIKQQFKDAELKVLIASTIFDQGIDLPNIDVLILGGGGKSHIRTIQRIGRGLRGESLHVIDFADRTHAVFAEQTSERLKHYRNENAFSITFNKNYSI